jgi:arylformamidase
VIDAQGWIDVTVPIRAGMVSYPRNPPIEVSQVESLARGGHATVSKISLGVHTGTHVDAPAHFIPGGSGVDRIPLDALMGRARVLGVPDVRRIDAAVLRTLEISSGDRILLKTLNSPRAWDSPGFFEGYAHVTPEGAQYLADRRIRTFGIDYLSVGVTGENSDTHRALLAANICVLEGLNLTPVVPGEYELLALPLLLAGADGAPTRVLLRPITRG